MMEKKYLTSFGVKETYKLYNYTTDPTESTYAVYNALTRTAQISEIAKNEVLSAHKNILKYVPLFIAHMHPQMLERAKETIGNITKASYIYAISYPNYGGYRVEHDPVYTAYITSEETPSNQMGKYIVIAAVIVAAALAITVIIKRRKKNLPT
ncbi:MAG: hypothetical protein ACUVTE_05685 [Candidatus Bathycorpusculaceae bacterium]